MFNIRLADPSEFDSLPIKFSQPNSIVVVAEDEETKEVKGICAAMGIATLEMWTSPDIKRRGAMGLKLLQELLSRLAASGEPVYYAFSDTDEIANYLTRLGLIELPYRVFIGLNPLLPKEVYECQYSQLLSLQQSSAAAQQLEPQP